MVKVIAMGLQDHGKIEGYRWTCPECGALHKRSTLPQSMLVQCIDCKEIIKLEEE